MTKKLRAEAKPGELKEDFEKIIGEIEPADPAKIEQELI